MPYARVRYAMPARRQARMTTMAVSVRCAFLTAGSRKAVTPLLTASTPVIAVPPRAKGRRSGQGLTPVGGAAGGNAGGGITGAGCPPALRALNRPMTITTVNVATKMYVGNENAKPASPV